MRAERSMVWRRAVTAEYEESPSTGYFNFWSGRHPKSAVRTLDLYLAWREGEKFPQLHRFENLKALIIPLTLLDRSRIDQIARSTVTDLTIIMGDGEPL